MEFLSPAFICSLLQVSRPWPGQIPPGEENRCSLFFLEQRNSLFKQSEAKKPEMPPSPHCGGSSSPALFHIWTSGDPVPLETRVSTAGRSVVLISNLVN